MLFFFGPGQGGSAEQNVERWTGQFTQPDDKPSKDAAVVTIRTVNGLKQTSVDVAGTYKPMPMGGGGRGREAGVAAPRGGRRGAGRAVVLAPHGSAGHRRCGEATVRRSARVARSAPVTASGRP